MSLVIQETFEVPDNIAVGLATGIYELYGGVVRWAVGENKGQIVKHLKPIQASVNDNMNSSSAANRVLTFFGEHKRLATGTIIAVLVATLAGAGYCLVNSHKRKKFQRAFKKYTDEIRNGKLTLESIKDVEKTLKGLKVVKMRTEDFAELIGFIHDYTVKLAEDNDVEFDDNSPDEKIVDLRYYLNFQKKLFGVA